MELVPSRDGGFEVVPEAERGVVHDTATMIAIPRTNHDRGERCCQRCGSSGVRDAVGVGFRVLSSFDRRPGGEGQVDSIRVLGRCWDHRPLLRKNQLRVPGRITTRLLWGQSHRDRAVAVPHPHQKNIGNKREAVPLPYLNKIAVISGNYR